MKNRYTKYYSKRLLWGKLKHFSKQAGLKVVYAVLLLYYILIDKNVKIKTKATIVAALGYFILPLDAIPDLTPIIGFTDDLGVLLFALSQVWENITPKIKERAKIQLEEWFGKVDEKELIVWEEQIGG